MLSQTKIDKRGISLRVGIVEVAQRAGVSNATVSRVLSNKPYVREELRQRVLAAVEELGYQPNRVARSLQGQRSKIVGVIISDIQNPFFTHLVRAVEDVAYANEHAIFLCNTDEDPAKEKLYIDLMRAERVAGVVITPTNESEPYCRHLLDAGIPVVSVDRRLTEPAVDTVVMDNVGATRALISHLIDDGHRDIGALVAMQEITTGRERYQGFVEALQAHDIPLHAEWVRMGHPNQENGYRFTQELLSLPERPTALFTGNNLLTVGALHAIQEQGLSIPEDIALVAFDEMEWMSLVRPMLTVVHQPTYELGRLAADLIFQRMENPDRPIQEIVLPPNICIRQSCGCHGRKESPMP